MKRTATLIILVSAFTAVLAPTLSTTAENRPGVSLKWKFRVGYKAYLAVADGVIYAASPTGCTDYVPCGPPARLFALDGGTGKQKWMLEGIGDESSPLITGGVVYQASRLLYGIATQTGEVRWRYTPSHGSIMHTPAVSDETIFFTEVNALIPAGYFGGQVHAVDLKTRQERWKFSIEHGMVSRPVVSGGMIYVATSDNEMGSHGWLYALDARTGSVRWRLGRGGPAPAVSSRLVYYGSSSGFLYALDARTGRQKWRFKALGGFLSPPVVDRGLVYLALYGGHLHAVEAITGRQKWEFARGLTGESPAIAAGVVYFGSTDGSVYAVDASTGQEIWQFKLEGNTYVVSSPVVDNRIVYVASGDGYICAIE